MCWFIHYFRYETQYLALRETNAILKPCDNRVMRKIQSEWEAVTGAYRQFHTRALLNLYFKQILLGLGYA